ncbi:uncharacterized protein BO88DRAFT_465092 [Aspergillus vadensis CBS 113365]|uniref:Rhodopsin domain-containing protein n=1 Tax=Aspergillus vadensis (strain CBS 113365 / IMI 142717 / IBT 24658) TaxID=1448311 RepID=A0A319B5I6_ASPVC|nr:hypothetical protein BO88DRAFT_465092 [Aspergillus vadensis CBS 113365]PYH68066.1 hypothetical protein BO88DRAFT_465092 [Aspergillus vadensis CBS 113365]
MDIRDLNPSIIAVFGQPPAHIDLADSQVRRDNTAVIILLVLSIIAVGLRFIARLAVRNPFQLDDWLILVSLVREQHESIRNWSSSPNIDIATYQVFVAATAGLSLAGGAFGAGKHVWAASLADVSTIFKVRLCDTFGIICGSSPGRSCSHTPLCMLPDLFISLSPSESPFYLDLCSRSLTLLLSGWPWGTAANRCPISGISSRVRRERALTLTHSFSQPGVCVASAVRIYVLYRFTQARDITWMMGPLFIWSSIEPSVAIVCACLPHLGPLARLTRIRLLSSQGSKGNQFPFSGSPRKPSRCHGGRAHWQAGIRLSQPGRVRTLTSTCEVAEDEVGLANLGTDDTTAQHTPSLRSTLGCPIPDHSIVVRSSLEQSVSCR